MKPTLTACGQRNRAAIKKWWDSLKEVEQRMFIEAVFRRAIQNKKVVDTRAKKG